MEKKRYYDIPDYVNDMVIFSDADYFNVIDCESYHAGLYENIVFSSPSYKECRKYIINLDNYALRYLRGKRGFFLLKLLIRILLKIFPSKNRDPEITIDSEASNMSIRSTNAREIYYAGWMLPFQEAKVGNHPVFEFTKYPPMGYTYHRHRLRVSRGIKRKNFINILKTVTRYSYLFWKDGVAVGYILRFWLTRQLSGENCAIKPGLNTVVLYPSFLFLCPNHRWMLEIEDMLTMMSPFVANGSTNPDLNKEHPIVKMVGVMISQPECGAIICHLKQMADGLKKLYADRPYASEKIVHIALGMPLAAPVSRDLVSTQGRPIKILFISGWAQDRRAVFRRGLLNCLEICRQLKERELHFELTIRAPLPELSDRFLDILGYDEITHLDEKLSATKLRQLYSSHDILLFPAPRIALTTLITAMQNSMAIVASDGFGVEEYIIHKQNGLIAKGFYGSSGWIDDDGIFRENYVCSLKVQHSVCHNAVYHLEYLINDRKKLKFYQERSRKYAEQVYSISAWNRNFDNKLQHLWLDHTSSQNQEPYYMQESN